MVMSGAAVMRGEQTIGDFVLINALLMQLSVPLNFIGFVYREIKQGLIDIEAMFGLLDVSPEIVDRPDAKTLVVKNATVTLRGRHLPLRSGAGDHQGHLLRGAGRPDDRRRRSLGRRQVDHLAPPLPLLRRDRRPHPDRRTGCARGDAGVAPRRDRHGPAGHRPLQRHHRLQHPLRPARGERRGGRAPPPPPPRSATSSNRCPTATRPRSASAA